MKIEWDEPKPPRGNTDGLWTKVKNNLSVLRQTHDGPPPRSSSRGNSYSSSPSPASRSRSTSSRPSASSHTTHQSTRSRSAGPRPYVTISTNGGPPQTVSPMGGQYGSAFVVQTSPVVVSPGGYSGGYSTPGQVVYNAPPPMPIYSTPTLSPRPAPAHRHTHTQAPPRAGGGGYYSPSPLRSPTASTPTSSARATPKRSATSPAVATSSSNGGVMYNGKLIVGDPAEVERYVSSQKSIEKWLQNVKG